MTSQVRIARRLAGGAAGAPASLRGGELAFNEQTNVLYYGKGDNGSGVATSIIQIGGSGATGTWGITLPWANISGKPTTISGYGITDALTGSGSETSTAMKVFHAPMSSQDDFLNSPISIRERGGAGAGDGEDRDAPNINFHWSNRVSNSLWMGADGRLNWGSYDSAGVPASNGTVEASTFIGALSGNATTATTASAAPWSGITGKPTTLSGYGITDAAPLASPALTGTPTAPTAAANTNTTQIATTAFVVAQIADDAPTKTGGGASGSWGISVTGSAATLTTSRNINGVGFNGSANINVPNLLGTNGTTTLATTGVASGVNYLNITNAIAGAAVGLSTAGSDTNIGLTISTKGTGAIILDTGTGAGQIDLKPGSSNVRIWDDNSTHYYQFVTGDRTANYNINLPAGDVTLPVGTLVPTTGTGATGSWGISITGNAATVTNGVYTTGDQTIAGVKTFTSGMLVTNFKAAAMGGSEGGEIYLAKPATGSTLGADVVVDVYQDSLRIFEGASPFRGLTCNLTNCGTQSTIIHSSNYTSYAPSLTGSGASGTWGISITGSSASCTGNAATVTNGVYTTGTQTITGVKTFSAGIIPGELQGYPDYEVLLDYGADVAGTWRRLVNVVSPNIEYSAIGFKVEVTDPKANYPVIASVDNVITETYYVACVRTEGTVLDTPNACYVRGPGNRIRATRTATGTYQIQIQNEAQWREYRVKISVYAVNGSHNVIYYPGDTASAGTAQYNASVSSTSEDVFQNIEVKGTATATTFSGALSGNATTATTLQNTRTINGTNFNGSANITTANWGTARTLTIGSTGKSVNGSADVSWSLAEIGAVPVAGGTMTGVLTVDVGNNQILLHNGVGSNTPTSILRCDGTNMYFLLSAAGTSASGTWTTARPLYWNLTNGALGSDNGQTFTGGTTINTSLTVNGTATATTFSGALSGNATTATTLQTTRSINGTNFNGSANITTANWGTARTLTIGNTGKSVNGSANVSWSLSEIGAMPAAGGTMTGGLTIAYASNASIEIGRVDGVASTPYIDFHSGATATDYDTRIIASGGNGTSGNGLLTLTGNARCTKDWTVDGFTYSVASGRRFAYECTSNSDTGLFINTFSTLTSVMHASQAKKAAATDYSFYWGMSGDGTTAGTDIEVSMRGDGVCFADGSWNGGGADYAEYFEWEDGNPNNEDRRGMSVVLVGDKIRVALEGEEPVGVISGNPSVIGDAAWNKWAGKHLKDDFGSYIWEEYEEYDEEKDEMVTSHRRILNPDYDPEEEYIPRERRPEWSAVGLLGKLRVRVGQVLGARWLKMRDISENVEEWLVR